MGSEQFAVPPVSTAGRIADHGEGSWRLVDGDGELLGFVEIDRVVASRSCGGIRAGPRVSAEEIRRIAEVMTLKCGFAGLAAGGAKGGVIVPENYTTSQRTARLEEYGRAAATLLRSGVWSHGADMGTTDFDIAKIRHAAGVGPDPGLSLGTQTPKPGDANSGFAAGLTVALAAEAALESLGVALHGARVVVQGGGAVGRAAMAALATAGARVVAVSTIAGTLHDPQGLNVKSLLDGLNREGDQLAATGAPPQSVLAIPCELMLLCAGSGTLDAAAAEQLEVQALVCGANIPFTPSVADQLDERGILVMPDFVAGAGGVLGSTLVAAAGVSAAELEAILRRHFTPLLRQTLAAAKASRLTATEVARQRALRVIAACDSAYGSTRPDTLLPDRLAPPDAWPVRTMLAAERRLRGSTRLAFLARLLHPSAVARAERILAAAIAAGAEKNE